MKKGIIQVFVANLIFLLFSVISNFLLPKYLPMEDYAGYKQYILYLGYITFLADCGYISGMHLKCGGKTLDEARQEGFIPNLTTYIVMQFFFCILCVAVGIALQNRLVAFLGIGVLTTNLLNYFKNFSTAVGAFRAYSLSVSIEKIATFLLLVVLFILVKSRTVSTVILITVFVSVLCAFVILKSSKILRSNQEKWTYSINELKNTVSLGIIVCLGDFVMQLLMGLGSLLTDWLLDAATFAIYSFAVSLERIVYAFISPIATVFYNKFCQNPQKQEIALYKNILMLWGCLLLMVTFPLEAFIEHFLPGYAGSTDIINILFLGQVISAVISSIYVNLYKARKESKRYLLQLIMMIICSVVLSFGLFAIYKSVVAIAVASLVTKCIWLLVCNASDKDIRFKWKELLALVLLSGGFIVCTVLPNVWIGMVCYLVAYLLVGMSLMSDTIKSICEIVKTVVCKRNNNLQ